MPVLSRLTAALPAVRDLPRLPAGARAAVLRDLGRFPHSAANSIAPLASIEAAADWLCHAQDNSASADGGVARHFNLRNQQWSASYPETTGYIVPTMLMLANRLRRPELRTRARRMVDWLVSIQMPSGAFQGGMVNQSPVVPVTFNTGQVLFGLVAGVVEFGSAFRPALRRAADWLVMHQDHDGFWRGHQTPFARPGDKTYYTHVAWALFEAERLEPGRGYGHHGLLNVHWAAKQQRPNGWLDQCCLSDPARPLTHTIGYFLRGVLEAYRYCADGQLLVTARRTADGLLAAQRPDGSLPGRLDSSWQAATASSCLTGNVQIAHCWLMLFLETGDERYLRAASAANRYVRGAMTLDGPPDLLGGIAGSFPVWGDYARYQLVSWAPKFFVESQLLETDIVDARSAPATGTVEDDLISDVA